MREREIVRHIHQNWKVLNVQISRDDSKRIRRIRIDMTKDLSTAIEIHVDTSELVWKNKIDDAIRRAAYRHFQHEETFAHVYPVCDNCGYVLKGLKYNKGRVPITLDGIGPGLLTQDQLINPTHCPQCKKKLAAIVSKWPVPIGTEFDYPDDYPED